MAGLQSYTRLGGQKYCIYYVQLPESLPLQNPDDQRQVFLYLYKNSGSCLGKIKRLKNREKPNPINQDAALAFKKI